MATIFAVSSCNKVELPDYSGMDAIFFDQQYNGSSNEANFDTTVLAHKLYTPVSFTKTDSHDSILSIKVETTGYVRDYLRPFGVHIVADSTTAIQGDEFELLDDSYAILPGNNSTYVHVKVKFTERMYEERLQIQLGLDGGEYFELPFGKKLFGDMPKRYITATTDPVPESRNYDCSVHNIFVDCLYSEPKEWAGRPLANQYWGKFSSKKFLLILELVEPRGWTALTFENQATMQMGRQEIVSNLMGKYLREQYDKGTPVIDEDGETLMWVKSSLVTWAEDTKLSDLKK